MFFIQFTNGDCRLVPSHLFNMANYDLETIVDCMRVS